MKRGGILLTVLLFCSSVFALNAPTLSNPDDSLVVGVCRIGFQWSVVSDAKYYRLEVDTTKTFDSPVCRVFADLTTTSSYWFTYYVYDLYFNKNYYWRVKAFNADKSEESAWTPIRTFTTPETVTLRKDDDPNPTGTYYPKQTLFWKSIRGSSGYDIEWDTVPTFNSKVYKKYQCSISQNDEETQLSYAISNLYFNSMYYWRVRAYNKVDTTVWSETRSFHTLWKVNPKSPDSTTVTGFTQQTFYWVDGNGYPGITKYELQVDTVPTFDSPYLIKSTSSSDGTTVSYMPFNHDIYWRVRGMHSADTTQWSKRMRFHTYRVPFLDTPSDSATNIITSPTLYCNEHRGISNYHIQVDTSANFDSPLMVEQKSSYISFKPTNLLFGTTYYWRGRDCHKNDTSDWSNVRCFTTYYRGSLSSPANGATEVALKPYLYVKWTSGVSYYQIELDSLPTFDSPGKRSMMANITDSYYNYYKVTDSLDRGTTYFWRVRNCHKNDTSQWSSVWSFTTASTVATPVLKTPANEASLPCDKVQFIWRKVENAGKYQIEVDTTTLFNSPFRKNTTVSDTTTTLKNMLVGATHYWRVRAYSKADATIHSAWSVPRSFVVTKLDPVEKAVQLKFCEGDSAEYRGKWYYDAGQDVINAEGETRDTVITVTISVNKASASAQTKTITFGDDETWNNYDLSVYSVGQYILEYTTSNVAGCDSVVTLTLTVIPQPVNIDLYETACDNFVWQGKNYTTSQDIVTKYKTAHGGDSIVTMHLTINYSTASSETQTAIGSFEWHGETYTKSGNYKTTLTNVAGCDSVVTLTLTVIPQPVNTDLYETACDKFVWEGKTYTTSQDIVTKHTTALGGDSTVTMHLTINYSNTGSETQSAVGSFDWHGQTYTQSGDYQYTLTNTAGCDSVVTLHLTITPLWKVTLVQPEHGNIVCLVNVLLDQVPDQTLLMFQAFPEENYELDYWIGCNADGTVTVTKDITVSCAFKETKQTGLISGQPSAVLNQKVLRDGQILILRNGKTFTILGNKIN